MRYLILNLIHGGVSLVKLVHPDIQKTSTQIPANVSGKIDTGSLIFVPHVPGPDNHVDFIVFYNFGEIMNQ